MWDFLERQPVPISLPLFWPLTTSIHIYQTSESTNNLSSLIRDSNYYLSGRHANNKEVSKGETKLQDTMILLLQELGFAIIRKDQWWLFLITTSSEEQIEMPESIPESSYVHFKINKNSGLSDLEVCNGMSLINQPSQSQLQIDVSLTGSGVVLQGKCISGTWTCQEIMWHINELELLVVKIIFQTFLKDRSNMVALTFLKNGWYKESKNYKNNRGDLGIFTFEWDHDYCGVSSQCPKQISRSGISTKILCK